MTNLLTRLKNTVMADLNAALDQKEKQNPIALLNQYLRQCEQETEKVGKLVERQATLKDEFAKELAQAVELSEKRKYQAEIAFKAGETELHQFAAAEHQQYSERAERLKVSLVQVEGQLSELERKHQEMEHKLKDMNLRRMELMGRENITRANLRINQVVDSNSYSDKPSSRFQEIENYIDRLEHTVNSSFYRNTIDAQVAQLEKEMKIEESKSIS
ncbi:PspA/IM30 family protein [Neobacillus sp. FSL H8-0543]|uniref:PspA/IM30 family protein n=1 Tax=Neobacillus sp. FSL H8-0543 TaxID=2954672 RepID=UPI00315959A7